MYTQFFGNYLLQRELINQDQLMAALSKISESKVKLGTLALSKELMTASEVDECLYMQTREDKRFGEIAVERGYLTEEQIQDLLKEQVSDFILLGQILVEDGAFSYEDLERYIFDYKNENEIYDLELCVENKDKIQELISKFFLMEGIEINEAIVMYLELLFNSLIRFIGEDFTPLPPVATKEYPTSHAVGQKIIGSCNYTTFIDMDRTTAIHFANRYAHEELREYNDYVIAATEDFINLHNGLFLVNASNNIGEDSELCPPEDFQEKMLEAEGTYAVFPVIYPFGKINLVVEF